MLWKICNRRQIKRQKIHKLNKTQKRRTTENPAKQNYPCSVAFYDTRPAHNATDCLDCRQDKDLHEIVPRRNF